jgi:hypothetical protein
MTHWWSACSSPPPKSSLGGEPGRRWRASGRRARSGQGSRSSGSDDGTMSVAWLGPLALGVCFVHSGSITTILILTGWMLIPMTTATLARALHGDPLRSMPGDSASPVPPLMPCQPRRPASAGPEELRCRDLRPWTRLPLGRCRGTLDETAAWRAPGNRDVANRASAATATER